METPILSSSAPDSGVHLWIADPKILRPKSAERPTRTDRANLVLLGGVSQPLVVVGAAASDGPPRPALPRRTGRLDRRRVTFRGDEALPTPWPCARESDWDLLPGPHRLPVAGGPLVASVRAAFHLRLSVGAAAAHPSSWEWDRGHPRPLRLAE